MATFRGWPYWLLLENNAKLLTGNRLGGPINVVVEEDRDNWISACHRMISEEDDRLPARRNLDGAGNHAFARQFLVDSLGVILQWLAGQPDSDAVTVARDRPLCANKSVHVGQPVISWAA
jgi:hypothetical protein